MLDTWSKVTFKSSSGRKSFRHIFITSFYNMSCKTMCRIHILLIWHCLEERGYRLRNIIYRKFRNSCDIFTVATKTMLLITTCKYHISRELLNSFYILPIFCTMSFLYTEKFLIHENFTWEFNYENFLYFKSFRHLSISL